MMPDYTMMNGSNWGWGLGMMLLVLLFLVILLAVIVFAAVRLAQSNQSENKNRTSPLDIAKERYAKGDITKDEYERLKKDLV